MPEQREVRLEHMTRGEFRRSLEAGQLRLAIIATGSIEQHLEHLTFGHDIAASVYVAERVAERLYPNVVVCAPVAIGISEHHMFAPGSLTVWPGTWLSVVFDAVESFARHGVKRVLVLNGHGGNQAPAQAALPQSKMRFEREYPGFEVRVHSYWDLVPKDFWDRVLDTKHVPGHAQEMETAFALYAFPDSVRRDALVSQEDKEPSYATREKGRLIVEALVDAVSKTAQEMLAY
ncbi:MAG: creatininase family protein [Chloroflexota bacterium]|nr:creatininase family protein [Chloroflexota bacterium]